jgi:hypothetical protein
MAEQKPMRNAFARAVLVVGGIFYTISGVALFFAPLWFYNNIGTYPPFNRHYAGDLGAVLMPMGVAMVIAARNPAQHRLLFGFAVAGSVLHAVNHLLDELVLSPSPSQLLTGSVPLAIFAAILAAAYFAGMPRRSAR